MSDKNVIEGYSVCSACSIEEQMRLAPVGTIEGVLESLNIHNQPQFTVYDAVTGRGVRCYFRASALSEVTAAVGRKVAVSGILRRDPEGRPQQIRQVDHFVIIDEPPAEPTNDPAGVLDWVDDAEGYLEMIRGE